LTGDLGAGKTYLAGEIAHALGIPENVSISSPTFTIIKEYRQGRLPVYHMDLYRLSDSSELYELGLWEYYEGDGVCLVEWSNMFDDLWPDSALVVRIALRQNEERIITLNGNLRGRKLAVKLGDMWSKR
jgi:tRNA threonylcarbamoyladenosine biosynthesis protein TsaE